MILTPNYDLRPFDLSDPVEEVSEDFTLGDLFAMVHRARGRRSWRRLWQREFHRLPEMFGMMHFNAFHKEIAHDCEPSVNYRYLELCWRVDYDLVRTDEGELQDDPASADLGSLMDFSGVMGHVCSRHCEGRVCPEVDLCGISFTPVNEMAHLVIRMSPEVTTYEPWTKDAGAYSQTGFRMTMFPTLHAFITSVFYELTFYGGPLERDAERDEIVRRVRDVKSGKSKLIPFEDVVAQLEEGRGA